MRHLDLFAGIGGFRLAAEAAEMTCVGGCEIDKFAQQCYVSHFPSPELASDIRQWDGVDCDVMTGGFPCQDISVAGLQKGLDGERSGLFYEFTRLLRLRRPRWAVIENVPGLLTSPKGDKGRDMAAVVSEMGECGYGVAWRVLDSRYFGVPQRRRRIFFVGHLGGPCPPEILFEPESMPGPAEKMQAAKKDLARCLTASTGGVSAKESQATLLPVVLPMAGGMEPSRAGMLIAGTVTAQWSKGRSGFAGVNETDHLVLSDAVMPGARCSANVGCKVPDGELAVRRLTPLECERLQGFPDLWTAMLSDTQRYKCLGNAVTVYVARWILRRISSWKKK